MQQNLKARFEYSEDAMMQTVQTYKVQVVVAFFMNIFKQVLSSRMSVYPANRHSVVLSKLPFSLSCDIDWWPRTPYICKGSTHCLVGAT